MTVFCPLPRQEETRGSYDLRITLEIGHNFFRTFLGSYITPVEITVCLKGKYQISNETTKELFLLMSDSADDVFVCEELTYKY